MQAMTVLKLSFIDLELIQKQFSNSFTKHSIISTNTKVERLYIYIHNIMHLHITHTSTRSIGKLYSALGVSMGVRWLSCGHRSPVKVPEHSVLGPLKDLNWKCLDWAIVGVSPVIGKKNCFIFGNWMFSLKSFWYSFLPS